jgi:hypothetical protein
MTELHNAILAVLDGHRGRENRIGRDDLVRLVNSTIREKDITLWLIHVYDDRGVRNGVKELREMGHLICSTSANGGGYWLADGLNEAQEMYDYYNGISRSCGITARKIMESAQREFGGQLELR